MVTIDPRPTVFGDRMIITGTYGTTDNVIDLSSMLVSIDAFIINPASVNSMVIEQVSDIDGSASSASDKKVFTTDFGARLSDTRIGLSPTVKNQDLKGGTFLAIGRRS